MEAITTKLDSETVTHMAVEYSITEEQNTTPLYLPWWCTKAHEDGQPDGYLYEPGKTTIDAKIVTNRPDAIRCGIKLTFNRKPYIIETIEHDSSSPFIRVVAVSYKSEDKPAITKTK